MMKKTNAMKVLIAAIVASTALTACNDEPGPPAPPPAANIDSVEQAKIKELQKIFFSIPSPVEMASLIKDQGYKFDKSDLNNPENVDKYTGESRQAVNLGIYGADLSYAAMFDEKQETMNYFAAAQKLAKTMGIDGALTGELITRLDNNQEHKDSLLAIISEAYADLNCYLKENQRIEVSALVVAGGWLEALHLSCLHAKGGSEDLRQRIAEQKFALNNLVDYYAKFGDKPVLKEMGDDLLSLQQLFNEAAKSDGKTTKAADANGVVTIGTSSTIKMSDQTLQAIATKASELRSKYISF
ncbi:MAG: hypothetical protein ACKVOR_04180 [Flavobacteriales bacterium]